MAGKKSKGTALSVFKGREARLNRAILEATVGKNPNTIWDITKQVTKSTGLKTRYHNVNTRVKALERMNLVRKTGERNTKAGGKAALYGATAKAQFALLLDSLCLENLLDELDEDATLAIISLILAR